MADINSQIDLNDEVNETVFASGAVEIFRDQTARPSG
jgi:hypothetical protein